MLLGLGVKDSRRPFWGSGLGGFVVECDEAHRKEGLDWRGSGCGLSGLASKMFQATREPSDSFSPKILSLPTSLHRWGRFHL